MLLTSPTSQVIPLIWLLLGLESHWSWGNNISNPDISNHEAIMLNLAVEKPKPITKDIQYRRLKKIDINRMTSTASCINKLSTLYNTEIAHILMLP